MDELPDERTTELLLERTGVLLERLIVGAVERVAVGIVERVAVGVVDTRFTVLEARTGVATALSERRVVVVTVALLRVGVLLGRTAVLCERVAVCDVETLRVAVRTPVFSTRVALPRPTVALRSAVRMFVLPKVRVAVLRGDTRVVASVTLRDGVAVRTADARSRSIARALL